MKESGRGKRYKYVGYVLFSVLVVSSIWTYLRYHNLQSDYLGQSRHYAVFGLQKGLINARDEIDNQLLHLTPGASQEAMQLHKERILGVLGDGEIIYMSAIRG
ncbi:hypothetical protein [Paenibacillus sp. YPG26]|uniref:hypothetical protein n=1 Tax=Paenibacillus sp. YPG26 TaxID=2878915 RepID=UPI002041F8F1|nr:hypothetical protein [Paenibacillus sp. YPG26]USB33494.1 hypothetical protein LDO05_01290 [Paenibacillus sp. YPG26]